MRSTSRAFAAMVGLAMLGALPATADSRSHVLSLADQMLLVRKAAQVQLSKVHLKEHFALDTPYFSKGKRFATFEVLSTSSRPGSAVLGRYTVDVLTGDLWDVYVCAPIKAPAVRRLQAAVRKKVHLSETKYEELVRVRSPATPCTP